VWCHPERGAPDFEDGSDYYYPFASYPDALRFSKKTQALKNAPKNRLDILRGLAPKPSAGRRDKRVAPGKARGRVEKQ